MDMIELDDLLDMSVKEGWEIVHTVKREDGWAATILVKRNTVITAHTPSPGLPDIIVRAVVPLPSPEDVDLILEKASSIGAKVHFQDKELRLILRAGDCSNEAKGLIQEGGRVSALVSKTFNSWKDSIEDLKSFVELLKDL